jgi:hypothetical protein
MNAIITKFLAASVAAAVLVSFSAPAHAALYETPSSVHGRFQTDDDDDDMSGGALAVLLLAIAEPVSATLSTPGPERTRTTISFNRASATKATVLVQRNRSEKRKTTTWTSVLDQRSGTIRLSANGRQWSGKTDGTYYAISGDPNADELAIKAVGNRSLEFKTRKAGRVGFGGTITISGDGQSVAIDTAGMRGRQIVFSAR